MDFILPEWGGAMVHSDLQLTDNIDLSIPKKDVDILWHKNKLNGEKAGAKGNGMAGNGKIAACTFNGLKDNLVVYDYNGKRLWSSGKKLNAVAVSSTPIVDINNRIIACDNKKILMVKVDPDDHDKSEIVWESIIPHDTPGLLIPFSPTIVEGKTIILPTNMSVYAYNVTDGRLLAREKLGEDGKGYFSTINSACVNANRVYIATEYHKPKNQLRTYHRGRLYALDVNQDDDKVLTEAWYYPYDKRSQASPLFIDDTIYFDGYTANLGISKKPHIYALTDKGDCYSVHEEPYPHITLFSFSKDPRGGFWYEDLRGGKLIHFKKEDGNIRKIEEILIENLLPEGILKNYKPMSCMTICDKKHPVMLISAISLWPRQYLMAIDLLDNSVLWRVKMRGWNYAGGQFTILKDDNDPNKNRIVFGTYWNGAMAVGTKE